MSPEDYGSRWSLSESGVDHEARVPGPRNRRCSTAPKEVGRRSSGLLVCRFPVEPLVGLLQHPLIELGTGIGPNERFGVTQLLINRERNHRASAFVQCFNRRRV